jgi:hypothetical protein
MQPVVMLALYRAGAYQRTLVHPYERLVRQDKL